MEDPHQWLSLKLSVAMASVANGAAWLHSIVVENLNVGAIVTLATAFGAGACSGTIYFTKNVWPVLQNAYFEFLERRDKVRSSIMSVQMERLSENLEAIQGQADANRKLAEIAKEQADRLQEMYEASEKRYAESEKRNAELSSTTREILARVEDANKKLHEERREMNGYKMMAEALQQEIDDYRSRLGPVIVQAKENRDAIAATSAKVDDLGTKVGIAGQSLVEASHETITPVINPEPRENP